MHLGRARRAVPLAIFACAMSGVVVLATSTGASPAKPAASEGGPGSYLALVEAFRGGTVVSVSGSPNSGPASPTSPGSEAPTAAGATETLSVIDSKGSYLLQVKALQSVPGRSTGGESTLSVFDPSALTLTTWVVGSDGFVSAPVSQPVSAGVPIPMSSSGASETGAATSSGVTARVELVKHRLPTAHTAVVITNACDLYAVGPAVDYTESGRIIQSSGIVYCTYPSTISLWVYLQQFVNWSWYTVNQAVGTGELTEFYTETANTVCNGWGTRTWVFNTYAQAQATLGNTAVANDDVEGSVPCDPIY
jgi:hypothetical protein